MILDKNLSTKKYHENPNPNATIGFVVFNRFQFYVFKNVYKHLAEQAEFIIDGGRMWVHSPPENFLETIIAFLEKQNVRFRIFSDEDYKYPRRAEIFFSKYKVLVSLWQSGCTSTNFPFTRHIRKVHMNYGVAKELKVFSMNHRFWDLYLAINESIRDVMQLFTYVKVVGYPRFDDWFNNTIDEATLISIREKLDPGKKTVLYLPTHSDLSSIDELATELKKNTDSFNIIVKLHYYAPWEEPERVQKLKHKGIILYEDDIDLLPLLKISDAVLSDNSSAIFDAILTDKPIVVTNFLSKEFLDATHGQIKWFRYRWPEHALTYSGSIEQRIKRDNSVLTIKKPEELESAINEALRDDKRYKDQRKKLREELFAFNDGRCGERAAQAITELLNLRTLPEKPLLYHVLQDQMSGYIPIASTYDELLTWSKMMTMRDHWKTKAGRKAAAREYRKILRIKSLPIYKRVIAVIREFF